MPTDLQAEIAALRADVNALRDEVVATQARFDDYDTALEVLAGAGRSRPRLLRAWSRLRLAPISAAPDAGGGTRQTAGAQGELAGQSPCASPPPDTPSSRAQRQEAEQRC